MPVLQVNNLNKSFKGLLAIQGLTFEVREGEILGLMGPNGAGKTTTINLITGFLRPDSGNILFNGKNIAGLKPFRIVQEGITRTFQQAKIFPNMSILDNVAVSFTQTDQHHLFPSKSTHQRILDILHFVGIKKHPGTLAKDLPQDELRRLEMARAVGSDPMLILLDEPVSGLTLEESDAIAGIIIGLNQLGVTLIIIEHVMRMLMKVAHRLVVLNNGTKLSEGTPDEIRQDPQVVEAYLGKKQEHFA